jgi:hypothetical protein
MRKKIEEKISMILIVETHHLFVLLATLLGEDGHGAEPMARREPLNGWPDLGEGDGGHHCCVLGCFFIVPGVRIDSFDSFDRKEEASA